jgi:hypothetical protein
MIISIVATGYVPLVLTVRLQELLDLYRQLGVYKYRIEKCRRHLLSYTCLENALRAMLLDASKPGRQYFSLSEFIWRNRYHLSELYQMLAGILPTWISQRIPNYVYRVLRFGKRNTFDIVRPN